MADEKLSPRDILIAARAKIEQGWTQGVNARSRSGSEVGHRDPVACRFCVQGALWVVTPEDIASRTARMRADYYLRKSMGPDVEDVTNWNDDEGRTQSDVLQAIDRAIALASEGGE